MQIISEILGFKAGNIAIECKSITFFYTKSINFVMLSHTNSNNVFLF